MSGIASGGVYIVTSGILGVVVSYFLGAVPFGIIVTRIVKGVDVREFGSGAIGFTNVYRVAGFAWAALVGILDVAKGYIAVAVLASLFHSESLPIEVVHYQIACGLAAVIGHIFTIFGGFRGGKGVLTAVGVCVGLMPVAVGIAVLVFAIVFAVTRFISAGSLAGALVLPATLIVQKLFFDMEIDTGLIVFAFALCLVIFFAHRKNIARLLRGEENKFTRVKV